MSVADDFVGSILKCQNAQMAWPSLSQRGLPNFAMAQLSANLGGIGFILDFIPPNPSKLPSMPGIDLFLKPFMASISLPSAYPGISIGPLTIPGAGSPPYEYDVSGEIKMMALGVLLPFKLIVGMVTGIINDLAVKLPTLDLIIKIMAGIAADLGIAGEAFAKFAGCLALAILNLFTSLI